LHIPFQAHCSIAYQLTLNRLICKIRPDLLGAFRYNQSEYLATKSDDAITGSIAMSQSTPITSARNPRVVEARKLNQRKHRQQQGRFAVEGLQLLHMALDAGWQPDEVFYCPDLFTGTEAATLVARFQQSAAHLLPVSGDVLHTLSDRDTPQGIFATFRLQATPLGAINPDGLVVVLDRLQDPGNLGTLLRTADAAGATGVVVIPPAADPFDPKAIRASMGSLFNLPVALADDVPALFAWLAAHDVRVIGADARRGEHWMQCDWRGAVGLVLGNEAHGLSPDVSPHIATWAALPVRGRADSLNVAVAGGVLMYAWVAAN
jgi:TrmH family RNA methyltransferase